MKKKTLIFSSRRWHELKKGGDRLTLDILDLMNRYSICDFEDFSGALHKGVVNRVLEIDAYIWVPEASEKRGAKPKWKNGNALYAWLEVEVELQLARRKNSKITPLSAMERKFRALKNKPLCVGTDGPGPGARRLEIKNANTACRLHSEGKRILKGNQQLATRWHNRVAQIIASETVTRN